jgi:SAM-dependent methyltransferase
MSREDLYASPLGALYGAYMERPRLSRPIGRLLWGGDSGAYYAAMGAVAEAPDGATIVDCPCGAGPALRALRPGISIRYVGVDLSPSMLRRARKRVLKRGLENVELVEADATSVPMPTASAQLFLSFWGLHCFEDPPAALAEAARVLEPGGRLVGSSFVRGREGLRQRLLVRPNLGGFGRVGTEQEIERWLERAGFERSRMDRSGPLRFFDVRLPR